MHTIGMDTYLLITDGVAAAEGEVAGRIRPFRWWIRGKTAASPLSRSFYPLKSPSNPAAGDLPMTVISDTQIVPSPPPSLPELRAADQGVADALESVLSDNTRRVYGAQWRLFNDWCGDVGLLALPAEPLTMARYLAVRAG